jgi:phage terminase large subunit GpA-like protein
VWQQLDTFLMKRYRHECGIELPIARTFVDDGFRTHMVVRFTGPRLGRGVFAVKGASDHKAAEVRGPNQVKIGGVKVRQYLLGTQRVKSMLFGYFGLTTPGPGYCHVPDTYPANWFEMLKAEHLVTKRVAGKEVSTWQKVRESARNEAIDCRGYALAALLSMRIDLRAKAAELKAMVSAKVPERKKKAFTSSKGVSLDD